MDQHGLHLAERKIKNIYQLAEGRSKKQQINVPAWTTTLHEASSLAENEQKQQSTACSGMAQIEPRRKENNKKILFVPGVQQKRREEN